MASDHALDAPIVVTRIRQRGIGKRAAQLRLIDQTKIAIFIDTAKEVEEDGRDDTQHFVGGEFALVKERERAIHIANARADQ